MTLALVDERDYPHGGKVVTVDTVFDPAAGTTRWRAVFPNADRNLVPGMSARVHVPLGPPHQALLIPRRSVFSDGPASVGNYVSVSTGQTGPRQFEKRRVKIGQPHGDWVAVVKGQLEPIERIYVAPETPEP